MSTRTTELRIDFHGVSKKFTKGEHHDSLRDAIPSMWKKRRRKRAVDALGDRQFWALRDVSFQIRAGESMAIIGPNGSGKSTTLKLLSRILRPDRGHIKLKGRVGSLIELGAGFHPDLTGRENIYLNGTILGMRRPEIDQKFDQIVAFSELAEFLDTPVKRYSSGMYARLGFSVACHIDPDVLLVDEVLSVGDYHFQQKCFDKMRDFVKRGTSLVFVSHNLTAISTLCERGLVLKKGEAIYQGDVSSSIQRYHSFFDQESGSGAVRVLEANFCDGSGEKREVFDPGEEALLSITITADRQISNAHAAIMIYTADGQFVFDTATSRLLGSRKLNLGAGDSATITFALCLNLRGGLFRLGFTITSEIEVPGEFIYFNSCLKRLVMKGERHSNGIVHLNPRAQMTIQGTPSRTGFSYAGV